MSSAEGDRAGEEARFPKTKRARSERLHATMREMDASNSGSSMPKTTITEAPVDAVADGGHFATMPKEVSHATLYIPCHFGRPRR